MNCSFGDDAELDNVHVSTNDTLVWNFLAQVKLDVLKPWITKRTTELLKMEDDVVVEFIFNQLEEKVGQHYGTWCPWCWSCSWEIESNQLNWRCNAIICDYGWEISVLGVLLVLMSTSFHEVFSKSAWALHRSSEGTRERDTFEMIIIPSNNYGISPPQRNRRAIDLIDGFKQSFQIAACSPVKTDEEEPSFILFAFLRTPDDSYVCRL